ncbi:hypothetical protein ATK17_2586 [Branchiibius hedensis]|uniref:Uncharacterized protein n=1 Tax=Branchiibius hedensis TaxID=672460 RepID=A0A2Y8ZUQ8_9MICO|nr:hypothetical protein [Branchiibius hedensis]PWJ26424.1 hypothetical protein ATK17_2586 [Branchiibius hedensis]SSA35236.1 hypothetical protein SAMN04489750_2586 [Branchiibius hedensis]
METALRGVVGMSDLMHAMRTETRRIMDAAGGDLVLEHEMILSRLIEADLLRSEESEQLVEMFRRVQEAGEPKHDPAPAYLAVRSIYDKIATDPAVSPVAVVIAGAGLGSFQVEPDGDGGVAVGVARMSHGQQLAGIGAAIGTILGGVTGGVLGGAIGGYIGSMLDEKKDKKKT